MNPLTTILWAIPLAVVGGIVVSGVFIGALGAVARVGRPRIKTQDRP